MGRLLAAFLSLCAVALVCGVSASAARGPLQTAVDDPLSYWHLQGSALATAFARTRQAGANFVRIDVRWSAIAPKGTARPPGFQARDHLDRAYRWQKLDQAVTLAVANRLEPVLSVYKAPRWAQGQEAHPAIFAGFRAGPFKPSPRELGRFASALAVRYGGSFPGLPRVRYWSVWNEPNLIGFMSPQVTRRKSFSPGWYRSMVNRFSDAVHAVHPGNLVVAGNLGPISFPGVAIGPMRFMRELLCMTAANRPKRSCRARARFDVWGYHPYTSGGPDHRANRRGDIELGDLRTMKALLDAAVRSRHIVSRGPVPFWVTEFSWDTKPPDMNPLAAPLHLQARWTSEALYRMWRSGVSLVTWFLLRDLAWPQQQFQSGLYFRSAIGPLLDQPKPTLTAFRFPFVAFRRPEGTFVWGRTPNGRGGRVTIQFRLPDRWERIATIRADRYGIFTALLHRRLPPTEEPPPPATGESYRSAVLADGPVRFWQFDSFATQSSLVGGVRLGASGAPGIGGDQAVELDGVDGRVDLGELDSPATLELWVKTTEAGSAPIFSNRDALGRLFTLGTFEGLPFVFDGVQLSGATPVADGRWHHIVTTYSGVTGKVYVDGRLDGVQTWIRTPGAADATLGYDAGSDSYFKGSIDAVAAYDYPLSARQVRRHVLASGRQPTPPARPGTLRALRDSSGQASLPFSLERPPEHTVSPFGGGGQ